MATFTLILVAVFATNQVSAAVESCDSSIYCQGRLLDTIQRAKIFEDSKQFVDMVQINSANVTLANFNTMMDKTQNNPSQKQIKEFVETNFFNQGEFDTWTPEDHNTDPPLLARITSSQNREFAQMLIRIWPNLARKVKQEVFRNEDKHSLIPVPNGFIIPGGRFREIYYWDSYWIIKGLLLSEMKDTARGMLENFISLIKRFGFIPNGSRVYYLNRSQPPLLSLMVGLYFEYTKNITFLKENIHYLDQELDWWLQNRRVTVEKNGINYELARYSVPSGTPRPESYAEDLKTCAGYTDLTEKEYCYQALKSGAESGWDFSTRWIFDDSGKYNLTKIDTTRVIPVDLNAYLCKAFDELANFYRYLKDDQRAAIWSEKSATWQKSIQQVLYDSVDGIWYDYDKTSQTPRREFYTSNFAPLWADAYDMNWKDIYGLKAAQYFTKLNIQQYKGGIPTSLINSGEQWDLPNAWPPCQEMIIFGLHRTGNQAAKKIAKSFAKRWIYANIKGFDNEKAMFEKYDAIKPGQYGGGGEYAVQSGFGWTNGVALSIIDQFFTENSDGPPPTEGENVSQFASFFWPHIEALFHKPA